MSALRPRAGGAARGVARSSGRSAAAPTAAPGCSSRSRSCSRRSRSRARRRCRARTCRRRSTRVGATQLAARPRERAPGPLARDGRRDAARRRGSPTSCGRTASSSGRTASRPTVAGTRPAAVREPRRGRARAARLRRSSSWPIVTTAAPEPGANDNASGTAALIELARSYANPAAASTAPSTLAARDGRRTRSSSSRRTAARSAASAPRTSRSTRRSRGTSSRSIDLDAIAGRGRAAARVRGRPAAACRAPACSRPPRRAMLEQGGDAAQRPSALRQLLDLAFPFSFYEQAPFLGAAASRR